MMTESEFIRMSEELFEHIEDQIDLTIEAEDGTQIIVNRHTPNQELWIAAKSGGYHFAEQNGKWLATRDSRDFYDVLNEALSAASGEAVEIAEL